jgi:hypothetical protein
MRIQTPLMFILGDEDWRTPPGAGGEDLFRALKYLKRPTVMVRFPAEKSSRGAASPGTASNASSTSSAGSTNTCSTSIRRRTSRKRQRLTPIDPVPRAAMYRNRKQNSTASSPPF